MSPLLRRLYLANAAVLLVHQLDAACWHEWSLFRMPGGIDLYLVLHVPITLAILSGYGAISGGRASAVTYAWLVAASGLFPARPRHYPALGTGRVVERRMGGSCERSMHDADRGAHHGAR